MKARPKPDEKVLLKPRYKSLKHLDRYRNLCLWLPVSVVSKNIPWGYYRSAHDSNIALPDENALICFKQAREYLKSHSYEVVAEWLGSCGYPIGADGLTLLFGDRPIWSELDLPYEERLKLAVWKP